MTQTSLFDLPARHAAKAAPQRITADDTHFATIAAALSADIADVERNLETALSQQTGDAAGRVERDARVKHFQNLLKGLHSFQLDAVLGRSDRVLSLTPVLAKGLEFDLVVLVDPAVLGEGAQGAVARYVSMTRATFELVILGER